MYWYEDDVKAALQQADQLDYTPETVFYGSSSIRLWEGLYEDFAPCKPVNLGFGGSTLEACVYFSERMLHPYASAKILVVYAGDNDLGDGKQPEEVLYHFTQLMLAVYLIFPVSIRVVYLSIKPSIARWNINDKIVHANYLIETSIRNEFPAVQFVNLYDAMLAPDGQPNPQLYVEDGLHLSIQGYTVWNSIMHPALSKNVPLQAPPTIEDYHSTS